MGGKLKTLLMISMALTFFLLGVLASNVIYSITPDIQQPLSIAGLLGKSKTAPRDHITDSQIHVYKDKVVIDLKDSAWSTFTPTNSMLPVLDDKSNGLEITPRSADEINVGDIISYESNEGLIIHRVVQTGTDELGWYAILRGDNNPIEDPGKIRFSQIKGILVGVLY